MPSTLDSIRHDILVAALAGRSGLRAILFEPSAPAGVFRSTSESQRGLDLGRIEFAEECPFVSWLRVNGRPLPVPDSIGVFQDLPLSDQQKLTQLGVRACIPVVSEEELAAWIAISSDTGAVVSMSDIDSRLLVVKRLAQDLLIIKHKEAKHRRDESLWRSNRLTIAGQMAAGIAHEVRNPLAIIRSIIQRIRDGDAATGDYDRLHHTVISEIDRMNEVLSNMLVLGQARQLDQSVCDLLRIVSRAVDFCQPYAQRHRLHLACGGTESVFAITDERELRQVVVNVVLNACQACEVGGTVQAMTFRESAPDGIWAAIRVSDNGCGMSRSTLEQAFDPFFTTKQDGGGLGLAICRDVVERLGGRIEIESVIGQGTVVAIRLPWKER